MSGAGPGSATPRYGTAGGPATGLPPSGAVAIALAAEGAAQRRLVAQGGFAIGADPQAVIVTLLGSCVSACLFDPAARIGGMNHFLLPETAPGAVSSASYGAHAMELLVNALIRAGAARARLRAKCFGGARLVDGLTDAGQKNALFVTGFLRRESIPLEAQSLGGGQARRIEFWPASGRVRQRFVAGAPPPEVPPLPPAGHDLELF